MDNHGLQYLYKIVPASKRHALAIEAFATSRHCRQKTRRRPPEVRRDPPCPPGKRRVFSTGILGMGEGRWVCQ